MRKGNIKNKNKDKEMDLQLDNANVMQENLVAENISELIEQPKEKDENNEDKYKTSKDKLKVIILVIIILLSICVTTGILVFKYINISKYINGDVNSNLVQQAGVTKKETEDAKYLVSFTDMYTVNPLKIIDKLYEKEATKSQGSICASYLEISGLQDQNLQEKINKEIKDSALYYSDKVTKKQKYNSYASVQGNFSNILSIYVYIYVYENEDIVFDEEIYLNYNLVTGEKIKFLDLFASNTPMNSIIYDLEYERLAWDNDRKSDTSEEEWYKPTNMDKIDTSKYEDIILTTINKYKKLDKDNIKFYVSPNRIQVNLNVGEGGEEVSYSIKLYKYIDYVTMYKKFLTDKVVYENISTNKVLVYNNMMGHEPDYYKIESDNLFMSVISYMDEEYLKEEEAILVKEYSQAAVSKKNELLKAHTKEILEQVRNLAKSNKNKGYMARFIPYSTIDTYENDYGKEALIYVSLDGSIEEMNIDYYKQNAFKLLAKQSAAPKVSVDDVLIGRIASNDNKNVKSLLYNEGEKDVVDLSGYYTLDGVLVAKTYDEAKKYIDDKYKGIEYEEQIPVEVNIYGEEE